MRGYRAEEWTEQQISKAFKLEVRRDFYFRLVEKPPPYFETMVATTLPVYFSGASAMGPDHKDKLTTVAGGVKRLGAEVPQCTFKQMKKILCYARKHIHPQFRVGCQQEIPDTADWINNINHPESRKEELRKAHQELLSKGLMPRPGTEDVDPTECASFIKDEKYPEEKPSRWINSSSDLVKVAFGPISDYVMHIMCEHEAFIKTVPVRERAKAIWDDVGGEDVIVQSSDATAMEDHYANIPPLIGDLEEYDPRYRIANEFMLAMVGHLLVTKEMLHAVQFNFFWDAFHNNIPEEKALEVWTDIKSAVTLEQFFKKITDGYRKLKMRYFGYVLINGILCSGEMNTSLKNGNSMFTMVNFASYILTKGQRPTTKSKNEGDDAVAIYRIGHAPTEEWWTSWGWVVKIEFVGRVNEASFCGLVFAPNVYDSVPDVRMTLAKFGWTNRTYVRSSYACRMSLLRSKALSMACEYNNVPILGALAQRLLFLTKHVHVRASVVWSMNLYERERLQTYLKEKPWQIPPNVHPETRKLVSKLQNIPISLQMALEDHVSKIELGPFDLPGLDFPDPLVSNMHRTYPILEVPRVYNYDGRCAVVDAILYKLGEWTSRAGCPDPHRWPQRRKKMERQLSLLRTASI